MGTANFIQENTSCIYAVDGGYEEDWEDTRDNIAYEFKGIEEKKGQELNFSWFANDDLDVEGR